jgi:hypothetical protein
VKAYYFGCWQRPGHGLFDVDGRSVGRDQVPFDPFDITAPIDGIYAPRRAERWFKVGAGRGRAKGDLCFIGEAWNAVERSDVRSRSVECSQGEFLIHQVYGYTLMAWWDRTQGDDRAACNSLFIVEGKHSAQEMLALWPLKFPLQAKNLERADVALREMQR